MALGGALAASDRRYRRPAARVQPAAPPASTVPGTPAEPAAPSGPPSVQPGWTWAIAGLVLVGALTGTMPLSAQAQAKPQTQTQTAGATDGDSLESPEIEARLRRITAELRCLVCQNQTIADSHAGLAIDLKREVRAMLRQGASDQAVRDYMTQRYGDFVLYRPPLQPTTWLLWAGPALLLAAGATALVLSLRRRARLPPERFEPDLGMDPDADADPDASP
jgi:cytochrome c-type biogenesis protein CcmH